MEMIKTCIYARVSTKGQENRQLVELRDYAERMG